MATEYFIALATALEGEVTPHFGDKQITSVEINPEILRARLLIEKLQEAHSLPLSMTVTDNGVSHTPEGRNFPMVQFDGFTRYISPSVVYKGKKIAEASEKWKEITMLEPVFISGVCLFGASTVIGIDTQQQNYYSLGQGLLARKLSNEQAHITKVSVNPKLHPYETEYLLRILPVVEQISMVAEGGTYFHIPTLEYQLYGLHLYQKGIFSEEALDKWNEEVIIRAKKMKNLIVKRFHGDPIFLSPLESAKHVIETDKNLRLGNLMSQLANNNILKDPVWEQLLTHEYPTDFLGVVNNSYVYAYLALAREGKIAIAIEDPAEAKILSQAARHMKYLRGSTGIVGLYVHPEVVPSKDHIVSGGTNDLFYFDQTKLTDTEKIGALRQMIRAYK